VASGSDLAAKTKPKTMTYCNVQTDQFELETIYFNYKQLTNFIKLTNVFKQFILHFQNFRFIFFSFFSTFEPFFY